MSKPHPIQEGDFSRNLGAASNKGLAQTNGAMAKLKSLADLLRSPPEDSWCSPDRGCGRTEWWSVAVHTTVEAEVDDQGDIKPTEPVVLASGSRVLVTVLEPAEAETTGKRAEIVVQTAGEGGARVRNRAELVLVAEAAGSTLDDTDLFVASLDEAT